MNKTPRYTLGLDFGSNSARCLVVDWSTGREIGSAVWDYPSGTAGVLADPGNPHVARQSPADFVAALQGSVCAALSLAQESAADFSPSRVIGIGVDATASTPIPLQRNLMPVAEMPRFRDNLQAQAWMWKDHSAMDEAEAITHLAKTHRPHYLETCGGAYSCEWFFAKIWHCLNTAPEVFEAAWTWLELVDMIPALLAGLNSVEAVRASICAAGHKAMYSDQWGGYPDAEFLSLLAPQLGTLRQRLPPKAYSADHKAGDLCEFWAQRLGLPPGIPIAVGAIDAHLGAVGSGVSPGRMVKIIGTSACDILVSPAARTLPAIPGVCGMVNGSVLPGHHGIEAGQCAVGDIFNWFVSEICHGSAGEHAALSAEAAAIHPGWSGLLALDWHNGNRNILVDARLTGLILGLTLHTSRAEIYRALIEATAFGARRILDRLDEYGVSVNEVVACGGIAEKNPLFMQIYADVLGRPMRLSASTQSCALGSAIMAAVVAGEAAGGAADTARAQEAACRFSDSVYHPNDRARRVYDDLYDLYCQLHDSFGVPKKSFDHYGVMKTLLDIRRNQRNEDPLPHD